jgi:hypothetical protein
MTGLCINQEVDFGKSEQAILVNAVSERISNKG